MSNKIVDGVELLRMIRDGEIKENQEMLNINKNKRYYFDGACIMGKKEFEVLLSNISDVSFSRMKFEILSEEDEEIDIDSIEELNDTNYDFINMTATDLNYYHKLTRTRLNELIKAVKQLNKKLED